MFTNRNDIPNPSGTKYSCSGVSYPSGCTKIIKGRAYDRKLTEYIRKMLSANIKIDQMRINAINGKFFSMQIPRKTFTDIITKRNSALYWRLKNLRLKGIPEEYGIVIYGIQDALRDIYRSLGNCLKIQ